MVSHWILHFVQNDNPIMKPRPGRRRPEHACDGNGRRACSPPVSASMTLPPSDQRHRAMQRGTIGLVGAVVGFLGVAKLIAVLHLGDPWIVGILRVALAAADAALIYSVWQLGLARDRRWDLRGWVALGAMLVAWPVLLMFVTWTVIARGRADHGPARPSLRRLSGAGQRRRHAARPATATGLIV